MRWDPDFLYVGALLEEPMLWANLTVNNSIIYYDNDFEVFVDPDGSNHFYKELEINARNLNWNLLLVRPYLNGGPAVCNWYVQVRFSAHIARTQPNMCVWSAPQFGVPYWDIAPQLQSGVYIGIIHGPSMLNIRWKAERSESWHEILVTRNRYPN